MSLKLSDRAYWFRYNLVRWPFWMILAPFSMLVGMVQMTFITFFITDGSETLGNPFRLNRDD